MKTEAVLFHFMKLIAGWNLVLLGGPFRIGWSSTPRIIVVHFLAAYF